MKLISSLIIYDVDDERGIGLGIIAGRDGEWIIKAFPNGILFAEAQGFETDWESFFADAAACAYEFGNNSDWLVDLYFRQIGEPIKLTCPFFVFHMSPETVAMGFETVMEAKKEIDGTYYVHPEWDLDKIPESW